MGKFSILLQALKAVVGVFFLTTLTSASAIIISPVQLGLSAINPVTSFKVTNDTNSAITYQSKALTWEQINGLDSQNETEDLVITPPIVTIKPKTSQIFRVSMLKLIPHSTEQAYRVFLEDISEDKIENSEAGVSFKFNHNLPLFYTPKTIASSLLWSLCESAIIGKSCLRLENKGNSHFRINNLSARSKSNNFPIDGSKTILAGSFQEWNYFTKNGSDSIDDIYILTTKEPITLNVKDLPATINGQPK